MAGNFSFGDYFKRGAIELAWTLLTDSVAEGGYGFDPERIWATVYLDDDEAAKLWEDIAGLPAERIQRRGMADNYWSMGIPGPCGPSSEIYYDRGPEYGSEGGPPASEERYIEIWNLVFMQNERGEGTSKDDYQILGPLPRNNIDTGMGVERVAVLLQGVHNVYETDLLRPVIDKVATRAARLRHRQSRRRCALPDHRRPQSHRSDPDRRRRQPGQRRARLCAAPVPAPGDPLGEAVGYRRPDHGRPDGDRA